MTLRVLLAVAAVLAGIGAAAAQTAKDPVAAGKHVYQHANCMGCHKWYGGGGGGYGGDALSLRRTEHDRAQIIETITCGRPGAGMPFHLRGAYDTVKCYGMTPGGTRRQHAAGGRQPFCVRARSRWSPTT